ncbi:MAG: NifB/NifX family molybdenum-iron cluster-binding protein [Evtepia sp.]
MKIAVTYENGEVFQHFGHCQNFKIYSVEHKEIVKTEVLNTEGSGHGAHPLFLKANDVDVLICGGIGGGARRAVQSVGIEFYPGVLGSADESVEAFLKNELKFKANAVCQHHHEDGHTCGNHGCGEDKHACGEDKHGCTGNESMG